MKQRMAVILAAGKGTRMKSNLYKVMHPINGLPMIEHVLRAVEASGVDNIVTIVGHGAETVQETLGNRTKYALQAEQLGTGHAVRQAESLLSGKTGSTLVICGDTPLLSATTLEALFEYHETMGAKATILSTIVNDPFGYGRVIRDQADQVSHIVEEKDASPAEQMVQEINTGTYIFDNAWLFEMLSQVTNNNAQGEYYLPDVIGLLKEHGQRVEAFVMPNADEGIGINDRIALAEATRLMTERINQYHMRQGVTMINPASIYIEADVKIGSDTVIESGVALKGQTTIGRNCLIGQNSQLVDAEIADEVQITQSVIEQSTVHAGVTIGPFAHIRPNSTVYERVHIGNFVEVKNSTVGADTRAGHLAYIGDADVGRNVNVGCGAIFVNYDGKNKHRSTIGDDAFIGSNSNIVSPVRVADRSFIAAGSTITQDVEAEALAISRAEQKNIANYWDKLQKK